MACCLHVRIERIAALLALHRALSKTTVPPYENADDNDEQHECRDAFHHSA
ncbi:MAG: hypothetical protein WBG86_16045 [Polyangiales bacterium]